MDEKSLYLIAVFDENTQSRLTELYKTLQYHGFEGTQSADVPYHLTMGTFVTEYETELCEHVKRAALGARPLDIRLSHLALFGLNVLFAAPNVNLELLELQCRFFPDAVGGSHSWAPHATLLIDEPDAVLRALPVAAQAFEPFSARIESLRIIEAFPARQILEVELSGA